MHRSHHSRRKAIRTKRFRTLRIEALELRAMLDGTSLVGDLFSLNQNGPQVTLDVLANDQFDPDYDGDRRITSVSYGSQGGRIAIGAGGSSILYTPPADFAGTETFVYAVDGTFTATVEVNLRALLAHDRFELLPDGEARSLDVLANDPFWEDYGGNRRITAVSVGSAGGRVAIAPDGKSILYTPSEETPQRETFVYIVDDVYPAHVQIEFPRALHDDSYYFVEHDGPRTLAVLANDPFWAAYSGERRITHVLGAAEGTVEIGPDGKLLRYLAQTGYQSFRYVVDGTYEANVTVHRHRPVRDDSFEVDRNSGAFYLPVTQNDTYRNVHGSEIDVIDRVTAVTQSKMGGTVTISPDGQGVFYTPAPDYFGPDEFTYTADGVHVATVQMRVTRPVRDDHFEFGAIQDTAGNELNVLANDFLGSGAGQAKLITSVGATEQGGTVTIRGDGKAILYTPAPGYVGTDRFTYVVDGDLEASVTLNVVALAQPDWRGDLYPDPDHGPYLLDVLANDHFRRGHAGPGQLTSAVIVHGSGSLTIENNRLRFDPASSGAHHIRYTVDGKYESTLSVIIDNPLGADQFVADQNSKQATIPVLANDFKSERYVYPGARKITGVTPSRHGGSVAIAQGGGAVTYEPAPDFYGTDVFTYTVDGYSTTSVTVEVIRRVRDDRFRVDGADGTQRLPVLVNDLLGANYAGPGQITAVTASSGGGEISIGADGRSILYTAGEGFSGTDTFTYTVDGALKGEVTVVVDAAGDAELPRFDTLEEYTQFLLDDALERYEYLFGQTAWQLSPGPIFFDSVGVPVTASGDRDHSQTNVQVAGVDEGDIVEFDADYVYMLTDEGVTIVDAWPAEELSIASRIEVEGRPIAEFLHGDRLTVISEVGGAIGYPVGYDYGLSLVGDAMFGWPVYPRLPATTIVTVVDVSDRTAPRTVQVTSMEGSYVDSRGIEDFVYVLVNNPRAVGAMPEIIDEDDVPETPGRYETREEYLARIMANDGEFVEAALPNYSTYDGEGELVRTGLLNTPEDIHRPLVPGATSLISVMSFHVESDAPGITASAAVYTTGASAIYASLDHFYVFDHDYLPEDGASTRIMKFDWEAANGAIDFTATTTVPGTILNQFSADEHDGYLRIATTLTNTYSGNWSGRSENMLFVLAEDDGVFEAVGSLQNLALDERIEGVRFFGDRAFVSTFRTIDPLFAIDLADPERPESVGHITLPGFTSYMHAIDGDHLLTVGQNAAIGQRGPTQVAIFDIHDLQNPRRIAEHTFERFSTSEAETDHHAFGYFAEHGLLGLPVGRFFHERVDRDGDGYRETTEAKFANDLAVFRIDVAAIEPADRLRLVSEIEHAAPVRRSGFIGDKLYSIADDTVKVVDVAAPEVVIAELVVGEPVRPGYDITFVTFDFPRTPGTSPDQFSASSPGDEISRLADLARADLSARLGRALGAVLLVTAERAPELPGGGYSMVFRSGEEHFLYRASAGGAIELIEEDFRFAGGAGEAWHAVEFVPAEEAVSARGDFNRDGAVDAHDLAAWKANFGAVSLAAPSAADANRDGVVDTADYTIWRDALQAPTGDFNRDGMVDDADYLFWKLHFGATAGPGLAADANGDEVVDGADFTIWRSGMTSAVTTAADGAGGASVDSADGELLVDRSSRQAHGGDLLGETMARAAGFWIPVLENGVPMAAIKAPVATDWTALADGSAELDLLAVTLARESRRAADAQGAAIDDAMSEASDSWTGRLGEELADLVLQLRL